MSVLRLVHEYSVKHAAEDSCQCLYHTLQPLCVRFTAQTPTLFQMFSIGIDFNDISQSFKDRAAVSDDDLCFC